MGWDLGRGRAGAKVSPEGRDQTLKREQGVRAGIGPEPE